MKYELSACLCQVAISHAGSAAYGIKKYESCKESSCLKVAAYGVHQMTYFTMMAYCLAHNINISLDQDFGELASFVSNRCDEGGFLKSPLAALWGEVSDEHSCKLEDMSWDTFCDQLWDFARAVQSFYNEQLVPKVRGLNPDGQYGNVEGQRLTSFR